MHLVDLHATETTLELVGYLAHDIDINLMIQEIIYFQDVAWFDNSVFQDFLFKKVHILFYL